MTPPMRTQLPGPGSTGRGAMGLMQALPVKMRPPEQAQVLPRVKANLIAEQRGFLTTGGLGLIGTGLGLTCGGGVGRMV